MEGCLFFTKVFWDFCWLCCKTRLCNLDRQLYLGREFLEGRGFWGDIGFFVRPGVACVAVDDDVVTERARTGLIGCFRDGKGGGDFTCYLPNTYRSCYQPPSLPTGCSMMVALFLRISNSRPMFHPHARKTLSFSVCFYLVGQTKTNVTLILT